MFVLDLLDNLPRLRLSSDHFKVFLWALRELGVRDVPSFKRFRRQQKKINELGGIHTDAKRAPQGEVFYQNRVADLIAHVCGRVSSLVACCCLIKTHRTMPIHRPVRTSRSILYGPAQSARRTTRSGSYTMLTQGCTLQCGHADVHIGT